MSPSRPPVAHGLGDELIRTMKLLTVARHRAPRPHPEVDPMAYPLLFNLWNEPRRLTDLVDIVYADISTVSRQVTHLTRLGLIDKRPDPSDGRAQVLHLTDTGVDLLRQLRAGRDRWMLDLTRDWADEDVAAFAAYLARFADELDSRWTNDALVPWERTLSTTEEIP